MWLYYSSYLLSSKPSWTCVSLEHQDAYWIRFKVEEMGVPVGDISFLDYFIATHMFVQEDGSKIWVHPAYETVVISVLLQRWLFAFFTAFGSHDNILVLFD